MSTHLLQTKLRMPLLCKDLVRRADLFERLNKGFRQGTGFSRKLTRVAAPAGYGKTTLMITWLRPLQMFLQNIGEKMVIAVTLALIIEKNDEWLDTATAEKLTQLFPDANITPN